MQQSGPEFIPTNFSIPLYSIFLSSAGFLFSHVWLNLRIYLAALRDRSISENNGDRTPRYIKLTFILLMVRRAPKSRLLNSCFKAEENKRVLSREELGCCQLCLID